VIIISDEEKNEGRLAVLIEAPKSSKRGVQIRKIPRTGRVVPSAGSTTAAEAKKDPSANGKRP